MRPSFIPRLINDPFSDPGLFIPFLFERRALMFDLGDLGLLSARDMLKLTHVFVTHTHMDHFIGFDTLLRIMLGRDKDLYLFGPPGFLRQVEGKLSGYTWNMVSNYTNKFNIIANEVHHDTILTRRYACKDRFRPQEGPQSYPFDGTLLKESSFSVHGTLLDHHTECLGLSLTENFYINIKKNALDDMGLPVGPWLKKFKDAIYNNADPEEEITVVSEKHGRIIQEKRYPLMYLMKNIATISKGQKISYITDVRGSEENIKKIVSLVKDSDTLFIEATFLDKDREMAKRKYHLTAKQAGLIAKNAMAKHIELFHFSPRYRGRESELVQEAHNAFCSRQR